MSRDVSNELIQPSSASQSAPNPPSSAALSPPFDMEECVRSERLFCELEALSMSDPSSQGLTDFSSEVPALEDVGDFDLVNEEEVLKRVEDKTGVTQVDSELEGLD